MTRATWKESYIDPYLLSPKFTIKHTKKIWSRKSTIPSSLIGKAVHIHNGLKFVKVYITREKVGFKFGEFAVTRRFTKKTKSTKKKTKK
jgi:small subunit ribosomal protein S19